MGGSGVGVAAGGSEKKRKRSAPPTTADRAKDVPGSPTENKPASALSGTLESSGAAPVSGELGEGDGCDHDHQGQPVAGADPEEEAARAQFLLLGIKIENDRCVL